MAESLDGSLIMFDGPDGVGKTTQIGLAKQALQQEGYEVYTTRIHGGTAFGEALRHVTLSDIEREPVADHFVFMAMHTQLRAELRPRLHEGQVVLLDRSPLSDWAYQVCAGGIVSERIKQNIRQSMNLFKPDLVICYRASLEILDQHMQTRPETEKRAYFKNKPAEYHRQVIAGYLEAAELFGAVSVEADASIEAVHEATMAQVLSVLGTATK